MDSVVADSPGWGFVNHSSYVNFDNNVAFNVVGASFVTEAGNEIGEFVGNLAINTLAGRVPADYRLLNSRYGQRFTPQDMRNLQPLPAGLLGPIQIIPRGEIADAGPRCFSIANKIRPRIGGRFLFHEPELFHG